MDDTPGLHHGDTAMLFVPADDEAAAAKALAGSAGIVVLDLEDLLPGPRKVPARAALAERAADPRGRGRWWVRINALETPLAFGDLEAAALPGMTGIVVPKLESTAQLATADFVLREMERRCGLAEGSLRLSCIVETAAGIAGLPALSPLAGRSCRLVFGAADLASDLGLARLPDEAELTPFRAALVLHSRRLGLPPPIDSVWFDVQDDAGFLASTRRGRAFGLRGKVCITPHQAELHARAVVPSAKDLAAMEAALVAYDAARARGEGTCVVGGTFIDEPVARRLRAQLAAAR